MAQHNCWQFWPFLGTKIAPFWAKFFDFALFSQILAKKSVKKYDQKAFLAHKKWYVVMDEIWVFVSLYFVPLSHLESKGAFLLMRVLN